MPAVYKPQGAALPVQRKMAPAVRPMPPRPVSPPVVQRALAVVAPVVAAPAVATLAVGAVALAAVAGLGYLGYRYMRPAAETPKAKVEPPVKTGKASSAPKGAAVRRASAAASVVKVPTAAEEASRANREKQFADNELKKKAAAAASAIKLTEQQKREDAAEKRRQAQRDREEASAETNRLAKAQREAAETLRCSGIEQEVAAFAAGGLRAAACNSIEQDQKRRGLANAASARIALQAALDAQEIPSLDRWQAALGLNGLGAAGYRLDYHNGNNVDFTARAGHRIHITFSADSIQAGTSVGGGTDVQVMDSLLKSVTRTKRIHATEEDTAPANHFYYGDVVNPLVPGKQELSDALDDYVTAALMHAVRSAIARHGDI